MSGLLALLDDVAAIAKLAAAQLDDVAAQAAKAGTKAAGVVIDDAAVAPKYVTGLPAARELPIVWKIAKGSLVNKLVILLPVALLLDAVAPWAITPILMLGGCYLCFEGAEKIFHRGDPGAKADDAAGLSAAHLEETRVRGAIKTDFILSAEIMAISLAAIDAGGTITAAAVLAAVAVGITAGVYGAVALLVKADDLGVMLAAPGRPAGLQRLGRGIVAGMPAVMTAVATIGTAAMLWVGGAIVVHGLHEMGVHLPHDIVHGLSHAVAPGGGLFGWAVTAALDGVFGLALGRALMPLIERWIVPAMARLFPERS